MQVHPTAVIHEGARLGSGVEIGPYCIVGPQVRLGDGCRLRAHVAIDGDTEIGPDCDFWPYVSLGSLAQDKKLDPRENAGTLRIGARNQFREHSTVSCGSPSGTGVTVLGDDNMLLIGAHIGHDASIGNNIVMTNSAMVGGHTTIDDRAILGALVGIHQFCRIGKLAMLGGGAMVTKDIPPFAMVHGDRARIRGVNVIGMRRAGYTPEDVAVVKRVFRTLFWRVDQFTDRIEMVRSRWGDHALVEEILQFVAETKRGVMLARRDHDPGDEHEISAGSS